eukprot:TRINITY_DN4040_c0_g1_i1.p1 TRINITY_DN4040_c0_g1~~TRINITY_DN4040_c0_g1_i1.p1  ORF type:complete len:1365 (-),score=358.82 TRINITY_DN4040_c0_g1_i1:102-3875(-)
MDQVQQIKDELSKRRDYFATAHILPEMRDLSINDVVNYLFSGSIAVEKSLFDPAIESVNITCTEREVTFHIVGRDLQAVFFRGGEQADLRDSSSPIQIEPFVVDEKAESSLPVIVERSSPQNVKIIVNNFDVPDGELRIKLRTDFGETRPFTVDKTKISFVKSLSLAALDVERLDQTLLISSFCRCLLFNATEPSNTLPLGIRMLGEIEHTLLKTNEVSRVFSQYKDSQDKFGTALNAAGKIFSQVSDKLSTQVELKYETVFGKVARKVFGGLGIVVASVAGVIGAVAVLPGLLLVAPLILIGGPESSSAARYPGLALAGVGGVLAIPGFFLASGAYALGMASMAAYSYDQPTLQYINILKTLIEILGESPYNTLESTSLLEDSLVKIFHSKCGLNLAENSLEDISNALSAYCSNNKDVPTTKVYSDALQDGKETLHLFAFICGRFYVLRKMHVSNLIIGVAGVQNAGKSTTIKNLFGIETNPGVLRRTEVPTLYHRRRDIDLQSFEALALDVEHDMPLIIDVVDFPGFDDQRLATSQMTYQFAPMVSFFVLVFRADHAADHAEKSVKFLKNMQKPFVAVFNKIDSLKHENFESRREEFREHYAGLLQVPKQQIEFLHALDPNSIANLRMQLFSALQNFCRKGSGDLYQLALMLLPDAQRIPLERYVDLSKDEKNKKLVQQCMLQNGSVSVKQLEGMQPDDGLEMKKVAFSDFLALGKNVDAEGTLFWVIEQAGNMGFPKQVTMSILRFSQATKLLQAKEMESKKVKSFLLESILELLPVCQETLVCLDKMDMRDVNRQEEALLRCLVRSDFSPEAAIDAYLDDSKSPQETGSTSVNIRFITFHDRMNQLAKATNFGRSREVMYNVFNKVIPAPDPLVAKINFKTHYEKLNLTKDELCELSLSLADVNDPSLAARELFQRFAELSPSQLRAEAFKINLVGSAAIDMGGVLKGVFTSFSEAIRQPDSKVIPGLCRLPSEEIYVAPLTQDNDSDQRIALGKVLRIFGRMIAFALLKGVQIPGISAYVFRILMDQTVNYLDLSTLYPDYFKSIRSLCMTEEKDIDSLGMNFVAPHPITREDVPLDEDGQDLPVTHNNLMSFLQQLTHFYLAANVPWDQLALGVQDVFPLKCLESFSPEFLQLAVCGAQDYDMVMLIEHADWKMPENQREMLTEVLLGLNEDEKTLFLTFVTGCATVQVGFELLDPPITFVTNQRQGDSHFPEAHTCFSMLCVPTYSEVSIMKNKLSVAIRNTKAAEFGLA